MPTLINAFAAKIYVPTEVSAERWISLDGTTATTMGVAKITLDKPYINKAYSFGTGSGLYANQSFFTTGTIAAGTTASFALRGVLTNCFGGTCTFDSVKYFKLFNVSDQQSTAGDTTANITIALTNGGFTGWLGATNGREIVPAGGHTEKDHPKTGWPSTTGAVICLSGSTAGAAQFEMVFFGVDNS